MGSLKDFTDITAKIFYQYQEYVVIATRGKKLSGSEILSGKKVYRHFNYINSSHYQIVKS